jgi:hypothetical protein
VSFYVEAEYLIFGHEHSHDQRVLPDIP